MTDRLTTELTEWERKGRDIAEDVVRLAFDTVAERILVGGVWLAGPFQLAYLYHDDADEAWLSEDGTVVLHKNVQARTLAGQAGKDWDAHIDSKPVRDCVNSLQLMSGEDHVIGTERHAQQYAPGNAYPCHECDTNVPLIGAGPGLRLANHDVRGRRLPWPDEVDSNECAGSGNDIPDGEECSDIPGTAWCGTCSHVAPLLPNGELAGQLARHDTYGRALS